MSKYQKHAILDIEVYDLALCIVYTLQKFIPLLLWNKA